MDYSRLTAFLLYLSISVVLVALLVTSAQAFDGSTGQCLLGASDGGSFNFSAGKDDHLKFIKRFFEKLLVVFEFTLELVLKLACAIASLLDYRCQ